MTESSAHTGQSDLTGSNTCGTNGDMFGKEGKKKVGDHGAVMKQGVGKGGGESCVSVCALRVLKPKPELDAGTVAARNKLPPAPYPPPPRAPLHDPLAA